MSPLSPAAIAFLTCITNYLNQCSLYDVTNYHTACDLKKDMTFDFIIVGGGTAGSTLANRLSENKNFNILLIEAGSTPSNLSEVPGTFLSLQGTKEDWRFKTQKTKNGCKGLMNEQCSWPQGKVLGGGSTINAMLAIKGVDIDYNRWAELGNVGWDWETLQPYFAKTFSKLNTSTYQSEMKTRNMTLQGALELGLEVNQPGQLLGYHDVNLTIWQNQRFNAAKGYIASAKERSNLCVMTNTQVIRILFDSDKGQPRARGVQISDKLRKIYATKEVIISAGAVNSPKLLMLSGIGPKSHLEKMNITLVKDLAVGKNLLDHMIFAGYLVELPGFPIEANATLLAQMYCESREGPLGQIDIAEVVGWINTLKTSPYPDIQFMYMTMIKRDALTMPMFLEKMGFNKKSADSLTAINNQTTMLVMLPILLKPKSRGRIVLSSLNPFADPLIYPGYMNKQEDMETMLRAIEFMNKMIQTSQFKQAGARVANFDIPNCRGYKFNTPEFWKCSLKNFATTLYHPAGTCKMGPKNDTTAVVSPELKVHGVKRLRVVDASIMPEPVTGNTNIPTATIAERAADFIKSSYGIN